MFDNCLPQPVTRRRDLSASADRQCFAEPDLGELMRDPLTLAVMAADRVDVCRLHALLADVRRNLAA